MKKIFEIVRALLFATGGVLILVFNNKIADYIGYVVGSVAILYGVEGIIEGIIEKNIFSEHTHLFDDGVYILLGIFILSFMHDKVYDICIVWAVWAILRESRELKESFLAAKNHRPFIINTVESLVEIVFSILLIMDPEEHIHTHIILLAIEFLSRDLVMLVDIIFDKVKANKRKQEINE